MNGISQKREDFLKELEDYLRKVKKLKERSISIYLKRIRNLLDEGYSVADLCGAASQLWEKYGPNGSLYDPKDHGNTRAAIRHVDDLVLSKLLETSPLFVSCNKGWSSFRPKGKHVNSYTIMGNELTICYDVGFVSGGKMVKSLSNNNIRQLYYLFERAKAIGCLAESNTCINNFHGPQEKYDYSFGSACGHDCSCLFEGDSISVKNISKEYYNLINKLLK